MSFRRLNLLLLCFVLAGCRPGVAGKGDEQKDPYFLAGKNHLQGRNFQAAIEMFEKALDVNPRSASAHFELGILYEQQQSDYASALYHYQKAVALRPDLNSADLARQRIQECKRELAKSVIAPVSTQNLQRDVDNLRAENQLLKQRLEVWQNYYAGRGVNPMTLTQSHSAPAPAPVTPVSPPPAVQVARQDSPLATPGGNPTPRTAVPPASNRLHTVGSGDTFASVARRYNVKLSALQSANPTLDAKRLRPGQALVIPPP